MKCLDLFSGIGGMSLGLERAGIETVAFCEKDKACREVLDSHWPKTRTYKYIERLTFDYSWMSEVEIIAGGYPCVGHSPAGKQKGFENEESKLWEEYHRVVKEVMPKYCIIENSHNLRSTGLAELLQAFNEIGYDAEWSIVSAYSVGAPHQRERIYIVFWRRDISYPDPFRWFRSDTEKEKTSSGWWASRRFKRSPLFKQAGKIKPRVLSFDDGVPKELVKQAEEKIKQIGNALVPEIPFLIGKALMENENEKPNY